MKAVACELPAEHNLPLARFSCRDLAREVASRGIVASVSPATISSWLRQDAIRPWHHHSWLWPRDPDFAAKAGRVLDLYHGVWDGQPLAPGDLVVCADEKTSIQARMRLAPGTAPAPGRTRRVEFEYERGGALAYLAALDVRSGKPMGLCRRTTGIDSFHELVDLVMQQEPYRSATRVFWITDNGSSHRGRDAALRLASWYANAILVHTPIHASWLNQVEIYFSIVQRKVLTPNAFTDLEQVAAAILDFQSRYPCIATPFTWRFDREDLDRLLAKWQQKAPPTVTAA